MFASFAKNAETVVDSAARYMDMLDNSVMMSKKVGVVRAGDNGLMVVFWSG